MRDILKVGLIALLAGLVGGVLAVTVVGDNSQPPTTVGGYTEGDWDSAGGYKVDGTSVIDGSGNFNFTGTLTTTGDTNVSNFVSGGASVATTTNGAGTFTAAQVCDNNLIVATPNVGPVTLTFPSTAQLIADCLPTIGDEKTIRLFNATTTTGAPSVLTLADGANGDHQEQEGATTVVEGTEWAEITFMNIDGTNHLMLVSVTQVAD